MCCQTVSLTVELRGVTHFAIVLWITKTVSWHWFEFVTNPGFCIIIQHQHCCWAVWVICIGFKLNVIRHCRWMTKRVSADQRQTLRHHLVCCSLFLELPAAASTWWRALPTRCPSKEPDPVLKDASHAQTSLACRRSSLFFIYLTKDSSPLHHINESQLFLCFTIKNFIFGQGSVTCKRLRRSQLCVLADRSFFPLRILLLWLLGNK